MISINLLIRPKPIDWRRITLLLLTPLVAAVMGVYGYGALQRMEALNEQHAAVTELLAEHQLVSLRGQQALKQGEGAKAELDLWQGLLKRQRLTRQSHGIEALALAPACSGRLRKLQFQEPDQIEVTGEARTFQAMTDCLAALRQSPAIESMRLGQLNEKGDGSVQFTLLGQVRQVNSR